MSKYGTALKRAGLSVVDKPVKGRPGPFGPVRGILLHHTAGLYPGDLAVVTKGRSGLPGPLSQFYLAPDGTWHVVSEGRCNHAGLGRWSKNGLVIPKDQGNVYLLGVEVSSLGRGPIAGKQYDALIEGVVAICHMYGWDHNRVIRHTDYAGPRKVDIRNDLAQVQSDIRTNLKAYTGISTFPLPYGHVFGHRESSDPHYVLQGKVHNGSGTLGGSSIDDDFVRKIQKRLGRKQTGWFNYGDKRATKIKQAYWKVRYPKAGIRYVNGAWDQATWDAAFGRVGGQ